MMMGMASITCRQLLLLCRVMPPPGGSVLANDYLLAITKVLVLAR